MYLADFLCLFAFLSLVSGWIYFIVKLIRGGVKWVDYQVDTNSMFDHKNYYHEHYTSRADVLLSHDLHHRYSYHDEYNILNGRLPGSQ